MARYVSKLEQMSYLISLAEELKLADLEAKRKKIQDNMEKNPRYYADEFEDDYNGLVEGITEKLTEKNPHKKAEAKKLIAKTSKNFAELKHAKDNESMGVSCLLEGVSRELVKQTAALTFNNSAEDDKRINELTELNAKGMIKKLRIFYASDDKRLTDAKLELGKVESAINAEVDKLKQPRRRSTPGYTSEFVGIIGVGLLVTALLLLVAPPVALVMAIVLTAYIAVDTMIVIHENRMADVEFEEQMAEFDGELHDIRNKHKKPYLEEEKKLVEAIDFKEFFTVEESGSKAAPKPFEPKEPKGGGGLGSFFGKGKEEEGVEMEELDAEKSKQPKK